MNRIAHNEAEYCGKVPLNQTNLLQPHGYLFVLDYDLNIIQAGENINKLVGVEVGSVLNTRFSNWTRHSADDLRQIVEKAVEDGSPFKLEFDSVSSLAIAKKNPRYFIVEIDIAQGEQKQEVFTVYNQFKKLMDSLDVSTSIEEFSQSAIRELKSISGFDKIMIYKFDENWNGDVIAEVMEEGMDSYLGLKFPASDVPKQARDLYTSMPYRLIPDTKYEPVKLIPVINKITGGFTDLSASNLRSVASVHLEYLDNMKVQASMSTRIMVDGKLWGLISCHHRSPKKFDLNEGSFFEIFSLMLSARISWIKDRESFEKTVQLKRIHINIIRNMIENGLQEGLKKSQAELLKMFSAEGLVLIVERKVYSFGTVPKKNHIDDLAIWVQSNNIDSLYHQSSLTTVFEPALDYVTIASGIVVLPLHTGKNDYAIAFRPEAVTKANWGGNPNEAVQFEPDGKNYHPRSSFALWQQTVHNTAIPWQEQELKAMEIFVSFLRPFLYQKNLLLNN